MRIAVTGASGFLGRNLCLKIHNSGYQLIALGRCKPPFKCHEIGYYCIDDLDSHGVLQSFGKIDALVHLAYNSTPSSSVRDPYKDGKNISSSINLFEAAGRLGVKKVVFCSSGGAIYGPGPEVLHEDLMVSPSYPYGISKDAIEKYNRYFGGLYDYAAINLRLSNPYGFEQLSTSDVGFIGAAISSVLKSEPVTLFGDGSVERDFIYIDDVVRAFEAAIYSDIPSGSYNVGAGCSFSLRDVIGIIGNAFLKDVQVNFKPSRGFDIPRVCLDTDKFKKMAGWEPMVSLSEGVSKIKNLFEMNND